MSCVAGHQPNLYPYGGFFAKVANVDKFVIADNTQYVKKEYHNRNRIKLIDGSVIWLTIPVKNAGHYKQKINEAEIDNSLGWKRKHERTLLVNYKKAPYLDHYFSLFLELLLRDWKYLSDYNIAVIKLCLQILEIDTPVSIASELVVSGNSTGFILDICKKTDSDAYMHGKHARDYVDFSLLKEAGIQNYIQEYKAVEYKQVVGDFEPNLSILDILFNCGPDSKKIILDAHSSSVPVFC
jgi:hypothetical protein